MAGRISLRNIRMNNLRIQELDLEHGRLHVFCGPSGSGKSSLAFDVLYAEADRRQEARGVAQVFRRAGQPGEITGLPSMTVGIEQQLPYRAQVASVGWHLGLLRGLAREALCPRCGGRGFYHDIDPDRVVRDPEKAPTRGAFSPAVKNAAQLDLALWRRWCALHADLSPDQPWRSLPEAMRRQVLYGRPGSGLPFAGIVPALKAAQDHGLRKDLAAEMDFYTVSRRCAACGGTGLAQAGTDARALRQPLARMVWSAQDARWLRQLALEGLRPADPMFQLSSSTARKLRFFALIRGLRAPALIIFDEPAAGLTAGEADSIGEVLLGLRDAGHTVIAVEHRREVARRADVVTAFGPASGADGGRVLFQGSWAAYQERLARPPASLAAVSLTVQGGGGRQVLPRRAGGGLGKGWKLSGRFSQWYGFKDLAVQIPLGRLVCVTGPGGAGKSAYVQAVFAICDKRPGAWQGRVSLVTRDGQEHIRRPHMLDASPIGLTPASTPATYTKIWDKVRDIFAGQPEALTLHQSKSAFSFNREEGRCPACQGRGWLPAGPEGARFVECPACGATRYRKESLRVRYRGKDIAEVNALTVREASRLFSQEKTLDATFLRFAQAALDYLVLGQPSNTLSGGENLRVKLVQLLSRCLGSRSLYIMDNPCRGIGAAAIPALAGALRQLTVRHSVLVAENEPDFLPYADWVITLGKPRGGRLVVLREGPPA